MFKTINISEEQINAYQEEAEIQSLEIGNSKLGLGIILMMAGFVGLWGAMSLVSGLASCGDVQELSRGLMVALTGM